MKSPLVSELEPNKVATAIFLVQAKEVRHKKTGEPYLSLVLGDRSGELDAKMWDNVAEVIDTFDRDDFVRVKGLLQIYNNRPQLTIHKMVRVDEAGIDLADFFPASRRDPQEMLAQLRGIIASVQNRHIRELLELMFADTEIVSRYIKAPAAKFIHHAYLGGLIEHVLSMCGLSRLIGSHYKDLDPDLLLAGAILHDIGKIRELSYDRSFGYTSEGQLLGHIFIGVQMVEEKIAKLPDFPERLRNLLLHLILSHHGSLEFGSPKLPLFPEAMILHYLDDLDAKMESMRALVDSDRQVEGCWTPYSSSLERVILKKSKYLSDQPAPQHPAAMTVAAPPSTTVPPPQADPVPVTVTVPQADPAAIASAAKPRQQLSSTMSLFGDKLAQALREGK